MGKIKFIENVDKAISDLNKSINELSEIRDILIKAKKNSWTL